MDRSLPHAFDAEEVMVYLDGELEPQRAAILASHMEHCEECQGIAKNFRHTTERMLSFDVEPSPEILARTVLNALNSKQRDHDAGALDVRRKWQLNWRSLFASRAAWAFASALLVLALVLVIPTLRRSQEATISSPVPASRSVGSVQGLNSTVAELEAKRFEYKQRAQLSENLATDSAAPAPPPPPAGGELVAPENVGPMIVQTAFLSIVAKNYDQASAAIQNLTTSRGGYVEKLDAKAQAGNARTLSVALRIPAKQLEGFLADLRKLGHVEQESQSNEEVSAQYVDLQARLRSAQATERRLIELLATRTGKLEDVLDAERELARVRAEIESMQGQSAVLLHQVSYATVQAELSEEYHEKLQSNASTGSKLWNALVDGVQNLEDGIVSVLVFVLDYGLSILFWLAIFLVPAWLIWRRWRSRSAAKAGGFFQRT